MLPRLRLPHNTTALSSPSVLRLMFFGAVSTVQDACSGSDSRTGILVRGTPASAVDAAGAAAAGSLGQRSARTPPYARSGRVLPTTHIFEGRTRAWAPTTLRILCGAVPTASRPRAHF